MSAQLAPRLPATLTGDLLGGFTAALVSLPQTLAMGALVFLPLGVEYLEVGISAGFFCSIAGGLVAGLSGAARYQISGARASTSVVLAALVASLVAAKLAVPDIIALVFLCVFLGGALQAMFAWFRLGQALKFIPHPVLAGFMYGVALLIFIQQVRPLLGIPAHISFTELLGSPELIKPLALIVGLVTIAAVLFAPKISSRMPPPLAGLLAGTLVFLLLRALFGSDALGMVLGVSPSGVPFHWTPPDIAALGPLLLDGGVMGQVFTTAALLAVVGSIDSLLCAATIDAATGSHQDGDRVLLAQGLGNFLAGLGGGIFVSGTTLTVLANFKAGGRSAWSGVAHSGFLLVLVVSAGPLVAQIPFAVLAGIMVTVALAVLDDWSRDLFKRMRGDVTFRKEMIANLAIVALVCATTVLVNLLAAVMLGIVAATILLMVNMSTSIVHRVFDGTARSSLKMRPLAELDMLQQAGRQIGVAELTGYVFFGTADRMRGQIEALAHGHKVVILDFRRVHEVEASGARVLAMLGKGLHDKGKALGFSHVRYDEPLGRYFRDMGVDQTVPREFWFTDLERALEWAEDLVLPSAEGSSSSNQQEMALESTTLFEGLSADEAAYLRGAMQRREYSQAAAIFAEGDPGDQLYVVTRGHISIKIKLPGTTRSQRLAAFGPGLVFGEMALVEGNARSADAYAKVDSVLWSMGRATLERISSERPEIALKITQGFTRQLAMRLRATSDQLRKSY